MKKLFKEFKEFISRGNVLDLAVGVIIGSAFTSIVNSVVDDIFMPIVAFFTGGIQFNSLVVKLNESDNSATIKYGSFISAIVNFLVIAVVVFIIVKGLNKIRKLAPAEFQEKKKVTTKKCPFCFSEIDLKATRCPNCTSVLDEKVVAALENITKELPEKTETPENKTT